MLVGDVLVTDNVAQQEEVASKVVLGSYMPFAGVRYYALMDHERIADGRKKIGTVGWRLSDLSSSRENSSKVRDVGSESGVTRDCIRQI